MYRHLQELTGHKTLITITSKNITMTTGTKIAIGLGAVAVIGALIYFAKK